MLNLVFGAIPSRAVPPVTSLCIELRASRQLIKNLCLIFSSIGALEMGILEKSSLGYFWQHITHVVALYSLV